jgi:hypothetical protein
MGGRIIETETHVFEVVADVHPDKPGQLRFILQVLSGPDPTDTQWQSIREAFVRTLIAEGFRVRRSGIVEREKDI